MKTAFAIGVLAAASWLPYCQPFTPLPEKDDEPTCLDSHRGKATDADGNPIGVEYICP